ARGEADALRFAHFEELDLALEWGEERLLEDRSASARDAEELALSKHAFFQGLDADGTEQHAARMERRESRAKQFVVRKGDPADALYLLVRGRLSVLADDPRGRLRRLPKPPPGLGLGGHAVRASAR